MMFFNVLISSLGVVCFYVTVSFLCCIIVSGKYIPYAFTSGLVCVCCAAIVINGKSYEGPFKFEHSYICQPIKKEIGQNEYIQVVEVIHNSEPKIINITKETGKIFEPTTKIRVDMNGHAYTYGFLVEKEMSLSLVDNDKGN